MKNPKAPLASVSVAPLVPRASTLLLALGIKILSLTTNGTAAPADLDLEFGTEGRVLFGSSTGWNRWPHVLSLPNGHILVAGTAGTGSSQVTGRFIMKLDENGEHDSTFGVDGQVALNLPGYLYGRIDDLAKLADGKILTVVSERYTLASVDRTKISLIRLLSDGSPDTSFGGDGTVELDTLRSDIAWVTGMAQDPEGRIVVFGGVGERNSVAVLRLTKEGYLDSTFAEDGMAKIFLARETIPHDLAVQRDGKILIAGCVSTAISDPNTNLIVCRILADGNLDSSFSSMGKLVVDLHGGADEATALTLRPNGRIVVAGSTSTQPEDQSNSFFIGLDQNGALDGSFGTGGIVEIDAGGTPNSVSATTLMPDGRIIASCTAVVTEGLRFSAIRLMPNGIPDSTFGAGGLASIPNPESIQSDQPWNIARDTHGRILLIGYSDTADGQKGMLVRLIGDPDTDGDGVVDASETNTGIFVSPFDTGTNPNNHDTDGDGLSDGAESYDLLTDPLAKDTDGDGFIDGHEVQTGKSPTDPLDKPALAAEARTAIEFTFPAAVSKTYRIEASIDLLVWETVESGIVGTGSQVQRFYTTRGLPKRYFRVEEEAP